MTAKNGDRSTPKGVLLTGRQITLTLSPLHHAMLGDLKKVSGNVSVHDAAASLLIRGIEAAHAELKVRKFVWLCCNWLRP